MGVGEKNGCHKMVDGVLAPRAQSASGVDRAERANTRGPVGAVRAVSPAGQRAFGAGFTESVSVLPPASNDQVASGNGLLSTSAQILLAETRSQEASAPFVAPSKIGQAIDTYIETQGQVRDTIRANTAGIAPGSALASRTSSIGTLSSVGEASATVALSPQIDSSIDG